jgi:hypothetical protein
MSTTPRGRFKDDQVEYLRGLQGQVNQLGLPGEDVANITVVNSADYRVKNGDHIIHVTYTKTGPVRIVIPTTQVRKGRQLEIVDAGGNANTNNITVSADGRKISGGSDAIISTDYYRIKIYSYNVDWFIH